MSNVTALREKAGESEKITINLGYVDLGRIDLLVQEGFYSNRSDFIRTAIRNQLTVQSDAVAQSMVRHTLELGSAATILRPCERRGRNSISKWLALRVSQPTSPLNWL
jgi:Arc/MetJ-type ribon-helix-helix transcriptional regulator